MDRSREVLKAIETEVSNECHRSISNEGRTSWEREKFWQVLSDRSLIRGRLSEWGFPPIAVLPYKLWLDLCRRFGLYRFENITPVGGSSVFAPAHMEGTALKLMQERKRISINLLLCGVHLLSFGALAALILAVSGAYIIAIGLFVVAISCVPIGILSRSFARREVNSSEKICSMLWPDGYDEGRQTIKVDFVGMPTGFQGAMDTLFLNQRWYPCVAAAPGAIDVDQHDIGQRLLTLWYSECPVLYAKMPTSYGGMVAILDQYGSFPAEQEVLAWLKEEGLGTF